MVTPKVLTQDGNMKFYVVGGKNICFVSGLQSFCHRDIALDTDIAALNQSISAQFSYQQLNISTQLARLATDLAYNLSVVVAEANELEHRLQTMQERDASQNATILALTRRLGAVEDELDGQCGKSSSFNPSNTRVSCATPAYCSW